MTLRKQPQADEGSNFLTSSMLPGEAVEVVGFNGDWVQVRLALSGTVGWVRKKYLRPSQKVRGYTTALLPIQARWA